MKYFKSVSFVFVFLLSLLLTACASNQGIGNYNVNQALNSMPPEVKAKLGNFKFYFGEASPNKNAKDLGEIQTSLRTNSFAKESQVSCDWVFYSALINLKNQAEAKGANAVSNIQSNWKNNTLNSDSVYVCDNGLLMSGVALKGKAIKE